MLRLLTIMLLSLLLQSKAFAVEYRDIVSEYYSNNLQAEFNSEKVKADIIKQNNLNKNITLSELQNLENKWQKNLNKEDYSLFLNLNYKYCSLVASRLKETAKGLINSITFTDKYGLSVSQSDLLKHYWKEEVYKKTNKFITNKNFYLSDVKFNMNPRGFEVKAIFPLYNEEEFIGAALVYFNAKELQYIKDKREIKK